MRTLTMRKGENKNRVKECWLPISSGIKKVNTHESSIGCLIADGSAETGLREFDP